MRKLTTVTGVAMLLVALMAMTGCSKGDFVGSKMTGVYHTKDCIWAEEMSRDNRAWFETAEAAAADDYTPCQTCLGQ